AFVAFILRRKHSAAMRKIDFCPTNRPPVASNWTGANPCFVRLEQRSIACSAKVGRDSVAAKLSRHGALHYRRHVMVLTRANTGPSGDALAYALGTRTVVRIAILLAALLAVTS